MLLSTLLRLTRTKNIVSNAGDQQKKTYSATLAAAKQIQQFWVSSLLQNGLQQIKPHIWEKACVVSSNQRFDTKPQKVVKSTEIICYILNVAPSCIDPVAFVECFLWLLERRDFRVNFQRTAFEDLKFTLAERCIKLQVSSHNFK